jgi:hypothetical protein
MKIIFAVFLMLHGFAHSVGFIVFWRISEFEGIDYKTTILNGSADIADTGIRIFGIIWLLLTLVYIFNGIAVIMDLPLWESLTMYVSAASLVFCITGWPDSKIGVIVNILILIFLFFNKRYGIIM